MKEIIKGKLVSLIPSFMMSFELSRWYSKNPYHKFNKGDILILNDRRWITNGIRPVAFVKGFSMEDRGDYKEGFYHITLHRDSYGTKSDSVWYQDFRRWMIRNEVSKGIERVVKEEEHFKGNLEREFKKVSAKTVEEALLLYKTKEV